MIADGLNTVSKALQMLGMWEDGEMTTDPTSADQTVALMRARGGKGRVSKIDSDPELHSFIRSHIYRLPCADIVQLVADKFSKQRRTSQSAISRWWTKQRPQETAND